MTFMCFNPDRRKLSDHKPVMQTLSSTIKRNKQGTQYDDNNIFQWFSTTEKCQSDYKKRHCNELLTYILSHYLLLTDLNKNTFNTFTNLFTQ